MARPRGHYAKWNKLEKDNPLICGFWKKEKEFIETKNRLVVFRGGVGSGGNGWRWSIKKRKKGRGRLDRLTQRGQHWEERRRLEWCWKQQRVPRNSCCHRKVEGTSLVVHWRRLHAPKQGSGVWYPVWEPDPGCANKSSHAATRGSECSN